MADEEDDDNDPRQGLPIKNETKQHPVTGGGESEFSKRREDRSEKDDDD